MTNQISDVAAYMTELGQRARIAARQLAAASTATKNHALNAIADNLHAQCEH